MTTTHNQTTRLYPGMINQDIEIFNTENGLKIMSSGNVSCFKDIPALIFQRIKEEMIADASALEILEQWYPKSERLQIEKFSECRFGGLDYTPDITADTIQDGEYWDCPNRGNCIGEGKVCKAIKFQGSSLTNREIETLKLLATNYTNEVIAEMLEVSLGLYHKIKQTLYAKLNVQTKQEAVLIAVDLNIINRTCAIA